MSRPAAQIQITVASQIDEKEGQTAAFLVATGVSKSARTEIFTDYNFKPNKQENVKKSQTTSRHHISPTKQTHTEMLWNEQLVK